jgi:hypothetical protein
MIFIIKTVKNTISIRISKEWPQMMQKNIEKGFIAIIILIFLQIDIPTKYFLFCKNNYNNSFNFRYKVATPIPNCFAATCLPFVLLP